MTDPMGTMGGKISSDMDLVLEGGPTFNERLQQLTTQKDAAAQALRALNLGKNIAAARKDAEGKQANAETLQKQAQKIKTDAQAAADKLIADAKAEAQKTVQDAQKVALVKSVEADRIVKAAQDEAVAMLAKAKETEADANTLKADMQRTRDALRETTKEHLAARDAAALAQQAADRKAAKYQEKLDRLQKVLRELTQE